MTESLLAFVDAYIEELGGPGSGYHGHKGRPGEEGGSAPDDVPNTSMKVVADIPASDTDWRNVDLDSLFGELDAEEMDLVQQYTLGNEPASKVISSLRKNEYFQQSLHDLLREHYPSGKVVVYRGGQLPEGKYSNGSLSREHAETYASGFTGIKTVGVMNTFEVPVDNFVAIGSTGEKELFFKTNSKVKVSIKDRSEDVELGGPGSGHHKHKGVKGQQGGSAPGISDSGEVEGEVSFDEILEWLQRKEKKLKNKKKANDDFDVITKDSPHYKRVNKVANVVAGRMNFPRDRILLSEEEGWEFEVDGKTYTAGGDYNPETDVVRIFDVDNCTDEELKGMLTHEIVHHRYKLYKDAYRDQMIKLTNVARSVEDTKQWPIRPSGEVRPGYEDEYWAYAIHDKYFSGNRWEKLQKADGVTSYSTAYWEKAAKTGQTDDYDDAVNETLAEIGRLGKSPKPEWTSIYKEIRVATR